MAGVADDGGFGFAIAKALREAGATVCVGTWPPALGIFEMMLERGKLDASLQLEDGTKFTFEKIIPLDADFDHFADVPQEILDNKRYKERGDFTIDGAAKTLVELFGEKPLDVFVHCLANGPEVKKPLLETSRKGYLAAVGASAYSFTSMVGRFGGLMREGGSFINLSYLAAERIIPGYGGGMSSAKAALESDTRLLAYEAGRKWGHRINSISAGPYASRAASAIGLIQKMIEFYALNAPLPGSITAEEVADAALFLASPLSRGITGSVIHVDRGYSNMGIPSDVDAYIHAINSGAKETL